MKGEKEIEGSYSGGAPPLPIPNREVKPASADGTAEMWESRSLPDFNKRRTLTQRVENYI